MFNQLIEEERLAEEKKEKGFNTAKDLGKKECIKCGWCCTRKVCVPTPNELRKIAEFLKLTPKECINKYFAIDMKSFRSKDMKRFRSKTYFVRPIGIKQKDLVGKFIPSDRTFDEGKCIFLDENKICKIHSVRPYDAKSAECWVKFEGDGDESKKTWKEDQLEKEFGIEFTEDEE